MQDDQNPVDAGAARSMMAMSRREFTALSLAAGVAAAAGTGAV